MQQLSYYKNVISVFSFSRCSKAHIVIQLHESSIMVFLFVSLYLHNPFFLLLCLSHFLHETSPDPNPQTLLLSVLNCYGNMWILQWIPVVLHLIWIVSRKLDVTSRHTPSCCSDTQQPFLSSASTSKITFNYLNQIWVTVACLRPDCISAVKCKRGYSYLFTKNKTTISATTDILIHFLPSNIPMWLLSFYLFHFPTLNVLYCLFCEERCCCYFKMGVIFTSGSSFTSFG